MRQNPNSFLEIAPWFKVFFFQHWRSSWTSAWSDPLTSIGTGALLFSRPLTRFSSALVICSKWSIIAPEEEEEVEEGTEPFPAAASVRIVASKWSASVWPCSADDDDDSGNWFFFCAFCGCLSFW